MNILNNAIDALENSATSGKKIDNPKIWIRTEVIEGNTILIWIADNGCGIPEIKRSRIFEPFFTTKQPGQGMAWGYLLATKLLWKNTAVISNVFLNLVKAVSSG